MATTVASGLQRREALLDTAAAIVAEGDIDALSMETVAGRAGVSRPLVYKHFANKSELLVEVYRREATLLDAEIRETVGGADGFEDAVRSMIRAIFQGARSRGPIFTVLRRAGAQSRTVRDDQRSRDRRTVRFFGRLAAEEFGLDEADARAAVSILLGGIDPVLMQWRARGGPAHERFLEDMYVRIVFGGLANLTATPGAARPR